jgi:membrane protein
VLPFFLPGLLSFIVFMLIYRYVPNAPASFRDVWPGALLAAVLFEVLKNVFAIYIANFNNYDVAYGALGGILLFLMWTYLTSNILLIGAELASEYPRVSRGDYDEEEARPKEQRPLRETAVRTVRGLFRRHEPEEPESPNDTEADG